MSTDTQTEPDFTEIGRKLFALECEFIWAAAKSDGLPSEGPGEIAFAGRSNVGKSSLLNALTNRKTLARISNTPGRTQQLNFFALGGKADERLRLVDMPGYGYAAVGKDKVAGWTRLMHDYLCGRATLQRVYVLIDARHGLKPTDGEMLDILDRAATGYQVVLTKGDAVRKADIEPRLAETRAGLARRPAAHPEVLITSSETGEGIPALRAAVAQLVQERGLLGGG